MRLFWRTDSPGPELRPGEVAVPEAALRAVLAYCSHRWTTGPAPGEIADVAIAIPVLRRALATRRGAPADRGGPGRRRRN